MSRTAIEQVALPDLTALGNVPAAYRHHERVVEPGKLLALPGAVLKWYGLHRADRPAPPAFIQAARDYLAREAVAGRLELGYGLGFAILHYSDPLAYLIVGAWRDHQELWETLFIRDLTRAGDFQYAVPGVSAPTLCVWELAPVWHEREAWTRYLYSSRDTAAKHAYLADQLRGQA
jgi:hypothetical protein